jgi:hypothetical protein
MNVKTYYDSFQSQVFSENGDGVKILLSIDAPEAKDLSIKISQINVSERFHYTRSEVHPSFALY